MLQVVGPVFPGFGVGCRVPAQFLQGLETTKGPEQSLPHPKVDMNTNPGVVEDFGRFLDACATECFVREALSFFMNGRMPGIILE